MKRYTCGNGEGMFETKNGHWIEYSEHEKIVDDLKKQLELTAVVQAKPEEVCICNQIVIAGATGFCPKCKTEWV